jgi:regulatory protein
LADSPYLTALKLLARRELSVAAIRSRLADRDYSEEQIAPAIDRLIETGALDDARLARAFARTAAGVKGRGRLRVARELQAMGIERHVASEAIAEVFGDLDERSLIARAIQKKLRGGKKITSTADRARLYQYLMRQGFSPAGVAQAIRGLGGRHEDE